MLRFRQHRTLLRRQLWLCRRDMFPRFRSIREVCSSAGRGIRERTFTDIEGGAGTAGGGEKLEYVHRAYNIDLNALRRMRAAQTAHQSRRMHQVRHLMRCKHAQ